MFDDSPPKLSPALQAALRKLEAQYAPDFPPPLMMVRDRSGEFLHSASMQGVSLSAMDPATRVHFIHKRDAVIRRFELEARRAAASQWYQPD